MPSAETNLDTLVFNPSANLNFEEPGFQRIEAKSSLQTELEKMIGNPVRVEYNNPSGAFTTGILSAVLQHGDTLSMKIGRMENDGTPTGKSFIVNYAGVLSVSDFQIEKAGTEKQPKLTGLEEY